MSLHFANNSRRAALLIACTVIVLQAPWAEAGNGNGNGNGNIGNFNGNGNSGNNNGNNNVGDNNGNNNATDGNGNNNNGSGAGNGSPRDIEHAESTPDLQMTMPTGETLKLSLPGFNCLTGIPSGPLPPQPHDLYNLDLNVGPVEFNQGGLY
jgi:hypothetical protein